MIRRVLLRTAAPLVMLSCLGGSVDRAVAQAVVWSPHATYRGRQVTLGPTGARGWVRDNAIYVVEAAGGSPAAGLLEPCDKILGANGRRCAPDADPRKLLGRAIAESETPKRHGRLTLHIERDGKRMDIDITLRVMGAYGANWPYDCAKSGRILHEACVFLAERQYPDGHFPAEFGMSTGWAGLLWLASGEARFLDNARRAAYWLTEQSYPEMGLNSWPASYAGLFLAEYYLATGDRTVLPKLKGLCDFLAAGQMSCGSWGHNAPWGGYGAVNQVGLVCFLAMILAEDCGVAVDPKAMKRSTNFFLKYKGVGWIPYGDHRPWRGKSGNGRNALAAVAFALLGGHPDAVKYFSRTVAGSYADREDGHTGSYFSFFWGPLAAVHAPAERFRTFLDEQRWYYDLARTHQGGLVNQPNQENLGGRTPGTYTWQGPDYTTGGMALFYALPLKKLQILGAETSPFDASAGDDIKQLVTLYHERQCNALKKGAARLAGKPGLAGVKTSQVKALLGAAEGQRQSVQRTLHMIRICLGDNDAYRASELLEGLARRLGEGADALKEAKSRLADKAELVEQGRKYYRMWDDLEYQTTEYWLPYGKQAMREFGTKGPISPKPWKTIVATAEGKTPWRLLTVQAGKPAGPPAAWPRADFNDAAWEQGKAPLRLGPDRKAEDKSCSLYLRHVFKPDRVDYQALALTYLGDRRQSATVYLNGVPVARLFDGPRRGYARIPLRPQAAAALRPGRNCLAVRCDNREGRSVRIDIGLQGALP